MAAIGAIKIKKPSIVGLQGGGSKDVFEGDVLTVGRGKELSEDDARFLIASGRAEECDPAEKGKKGKQAEGGDPPKK